MGCCCSKKGEEELHQVSKNARRDPSPPPPPPEEEMVKEVLSETPKPKPKPKPKSPAPPQPALHKPHHNESAKSNGYRPELDPALLPEPEKKKNLNSVPRHLDERSEQPQPSDEACSLRSEATSVATPTSISSSMSVAMMGMASAREREWGRDRDRDREETTTASSLPNNKLINKTSNGNNGNGVSRRSSQLQSYSGELGGGGKKERSAPPVVSGVGCRSGRASPVPPPRNNSRSLSRDKSGIKRDLGERSARRSVSPGAKRRELAGPNKSGLPARRVPSAPQNKTALGTEEAGEGGQEAGKESLDNPSVSLECFIFL